MVTRILRVPRYSNYSRKNFVIMLLEATLAAWSLDGSRTSHVAKLLQKYWHGTPAFLSKSSNPSFFRPTSCLVFRSVTTSETILGSNFWRSSGMGKISLLWNSWHICPPGPSRTHLDFFVWSSMVTNYLAESFALVVWGSLILKEGMASSSLSGLMLAILPTASGGLLFLVCLWLLENCGETG